MISESENIRLIAQMGAERERASHRSKICRSRPLWVNSGHCATSDQCLLYPPKADMDRRISNVRYVPKADMARRVILTR